MVLSDKLISKFAKMVKPETKKKETTVYGTIVQQDGGYFIRIDGSDLLTPISATVDVMPGERVTALIKNHTVIVNGNITSPAARTGAVSDLGNRTQTLEKNISASAMINLIYPVGSLYLTTSETSPEILFVGTKWEQIKDKFLLSSGDSYSLGSTGGEASHTLTANEMPSHKHGIFQATSGTGGSAVANKSDNATTTVTNYDPGTMWFAPGNADVGKKAWTTSVLASGGSQPHNNMPPYVTVNVWKRIE